MQLNKNLLKGIVLLLVTVILVSGFSYLNWDMKSVWNDENTWARSSIFRLNYASQPTVEKRISETERYYVVPYCLLHEVVSDDENMQYSCSFLPNYFRYIKDLNFAEVAYKPDVQLSVKKGSSMPSNYLGDTSPTEDKLLSIGSNAPIPVSIEAKTKFTKPAPTFIKTVGHYFNYRLFKSKGTLYVDEKLTEWNITPYSDTLSKEELNDWSAEAWYDFQKVIDQDSLKVKRGYDLFNTISNEFEFYSYYCTPTKLSCIRDNALSPGSNIMLYMYNINRSGDKEFTKTFTDEAKKYILPFASNDNPSFKPKEPACENCDADFQDIQAYEFPICPIREIKSKDYSHENIVLFSQFMRQYALDKNTQKPAYTQTQIITELNKLKNEAGKTSENREFVSDHVSRLNILCNGFVFYKMSGSENVSVLESTIYSVLGERFGVLTQDAKAQRLTSEQDLKKLVARSYMQGSFVNYVADEIQAKKDVIDGLTKRGEMVDERRATINVGLTLYSIYLFSEK